MYPNCVPSWLVHLDATNRDHWPAELISFLKKELDQEPGDISTEDELARQAICDWFEKSENQRIMSQFVQQRSALTRAH